MTVSYIRPAQVLQAIGDETPETPEPVIRPGVTPTAKRTSDRRPHQWPMDCDRCDDPAVMYAAYSGAHLCGDHLRESVEKRIRRRIRRDGLVPRSASPEDPQTWVIGLSGGKDSVVLTHVLAETFADDPRIELVCLTIHEGIEGYRDTSLDACLELTDALDICHEVVTYEDEFGIRMDDVVTDDPENMAACAYCGVFRRDVLSRYAEAFDADLLLTGHNLDDEAQTALMNVLEGDVAQIAKHFEASLGPLDERDHGGADGSGPGTVESDDVGSGTVESDDSGSGTIESDDAGSEGVDSGTTSSFVPRAKPLRDVPEKEVALYAHTADLPAHITECPHADEAYRGEIQRLLFDLEERHPGTRHSIMAGYEELSSMAADRYAGDDADLAPCPSCGATTSAGSDRCRKCALLDALNA